MINGRTSKPSFIYRRLIKTLGHSAAGLAYAWRSEEAFRVEVLLCLVLGPLAFVLETSALGRLLLISSLLLVLIVELLNTAIEKAVDRISLERHELSKSIKDLGSAAVGLTLVLTVVVWVIVLVFMPS